MFEASPSPLLIEILPQRGEVPLPPYARFPSRCGLRSGPGPLATHPQTGPDPTAPAAAAPHLARDLPLEPGPGRLGVASSYGAPTEAFEEAFDRGVNYFYWGSMRKEAMARAIRNINSKGKRDELVIVIQSYSRSATLMESFYRKGLIATVLP